MYEYYKKKLLELHERNKKIEMERKQKILEIAGNDEIAKQTEWTPLKNEGLNYGGKEYKSTIVEINENILKIKPSLERRLRILICILIIGIIFCILTFNREKIYYELINAGLITVLYVYINKKIKIKKINRTKGCYYEGNFKTSNIYIELSEIYAIQLINVYHYARRIYYTYEVNMILRSGERYNIMEHGILDNIREDAIAVADFLDIPLWDVSGLV